MNNNPFLQGNTIIEQLRERPIPKYNDNLWLKGYKPYEILEAGSNDLYNEGMKRREERQEQQQSEQPFIAKLNVEVKKK